MDRAKRKEKKRLKRKEKKREIRKIQSITPLRRITTTGGTLECWVNKDYRDQGMASVLVLGHAGGDHYAFAGFLVDVWCVGLKDAWGRPDLSRMEFEEELLGRIGSAMPMKKIDADELRRFIAASIRFTRQNGFKLPPHYERWTSMLGDLGDINSADISDFGKDGKLFYMGTTEFLRQRLVGTTPDQFMARKDVHWIMPPENLPFNREDFEEWEAEQEDELDEDEPSEELIAQMAEVHRRGVEEVRAWCVANGQTPHERLPEALSLFLTSVVMLASMKKEDPDDETELPELLDEFLATRDIEDPNELKDALKQVLSHVMASSAENFAQQLPGDDLPDLGASPEPAA